MECGVIRVFVSLVLKEQDVRQFSKVQAHEFEVGRCYYEIAVFLLISR